ncbi:hypothetical protein FRC00_006453 [Tulasnella sp. 408]|nr:hypothetical protein FRC00_006453 [Tulasnella sp. 408]
MSSSPARTLSEQPPVLTLDVTPATLSSRRSSVDLDLELATSTAAPSLAHSASSTKSSSCSSVTLHNGSTPPPSRPQSPAKHAPIAHSTVQLLLIHFALGLALFLATTDVHLVATSLPTIASELPGPSNLYTWVGVAYILPQTVLQPLWGKMADITGRKSMMWLVIARGVSGAGAGGVVPMVWIITGEVVPTEDRAKWSDTLTCVWAASALAGPLLGGVFSVWINAPVCVLAAALLLIFLRDELPGNDPRPWKTQILDLNYAGLGLLVSGTTVTGASAIQAGFLLLPFSLGSALISLVANLYIRKKGDPKHMVILGFGISALGFGLMILLNETSCKFMTVSIPLIAGLGMGLLFRSPFAAMENALPEKDRAPMTACFFLVRFIGTSVGLALLGFPPLALHANVTASPLPLSQAAAGAIFDTRVQQTMPIGFTIDTTGSVDWRALVKIADPELRTQVLAAVSAAVSLIWVLCTPLLSISCLLSFFIDGAKKAEGPRSSNGDDVEKQVPSEISESFGDEKTATRAHDTVIDRPGSSAGTLANSTSNSATTSTTTLPLPTSRSVDEPAYPENKLEIPAVTSIPPSRSPSPVALRSPADASAV